jgi:outer membrane protein TolC
MVLGVLMGVLFAVNESVHTTAPGVNAQQGQKKPSKQLPTLREREISLHESIRSALNYNLKLYVSRSEKQIAEVEYDKAKISFFPDVRAHLSMGIGKQNTSGWNEQGMQIPERDLHPSETQFGVTVAQNLFNGFSTTNNMYAAGFIAQSKQYKLKHDEQELIIQVVEAYLNIWCGRQKVQAYKKREENIYKFYMARKSSYDVGTGTQAEIAEANSKYQTAVSERINAETELISAESQFAYLTGMSANGKIELPILNAQLPKNLETLIAIAKVSSPGVKSSRLQEDAADKRLSAIKGALAPSCDLSLHADRKIGKYGNDNRAGDNYSKSLGASLSVTIPIFANKQGNTYSEIEAANQEALKARFMAENTTTEVINASIVNWSTYASANARIQSSQAAVDSAEISSKANLEEEAVGLKSNTEIWANENTLLEAKVSLFKAQTEKIVAYVKLKALMGDLTLGSVSNCLKHSYGASTRAVVSNVPANTKRAARPKSVKRPVARKDAP